MIWLTWRQFRAQALTAAAALAAFAILLATTEPSLSSMYNSSGLLTCHGDACTGWPARSFRTCPAEEEVSSSPAVPT
jgi:hypothetical protein